MNSFLQKIIHHFLNGKITVLNLLEFSARTWLGYTLVINSPIGITVPLESLGLPEHGYLLIKALWDTGFLMHLTKGLELIGGLTLILNLFVPLTLVMLMPILITILGFGFFVFHAVTHSLPLFLIAVSLMARNYKVYLPLLQIRQKSALSFNF